MGNLVIDAYSYKRVYRPIKCEECPLCDGSLGWCSYYRNRVGIDDKPEFCRVVSITVEEDN